MFEPPRLTANVAKTLAMPKKHAAVAAAKSACGFQNPAMGGGFPVCNTLAPNATRMVPAIPPASTWVAIIIKGTISESASAPTENLGLQIDIAANLHSPGTERARSMKVQSQNARRFLRPPPRMLRG